MHDKFSEARARAQGMLNSVGDAVISIDRRGKVSYFNPVAETMTGWASVVATGRPLQEVHDGTDPQTLLRKADDSMFHAKRSGGNTYRLWSRPPKRA